ncbi:MAG: leucine-rich repeat domain-containing protein, partial [Lachnospiraceae bacterium]|nr:leucine-rich repeat domain-containing protein [Lachnospiraceae bacterium]
MKQRKWKQILSMGLSAALSITSCITADFWAADAALYTVAAAGLEGVENAELSGDPTIKGSQNMGEIQNDGKTTYWYANNAFYGMKRNGASGWENYDQDTWMLLDTDAIWKDEYLYTRFGTTGVQNGKLYGRGDVNTYQNTLSDENHYYQKILTYGEKLWTLLNTDFSEEEKSTIRPAQITTAQGYRTYEHPGPTMGQSYSKPLLGANAENILKNIYDCYKQAYEKSEGVDDSDVSLENGVNENGEYRTRSIGAAVKVVDSAYNNLSAKSDSALQITGNNIYTLTKAHMYAPNRREAETNRGAVKAVQQNLAKVQPKSEDSSQEDSYGRYIRSKFWTRDFAGLNTDNGYFVGYSIQENGDPGTGLNIADPGAFVPAINVDTKEIVMVRDALSDANTTPSADLGAVNLDNLNSDREFVLESSDLSIQTAIQGKSLTNVDAGKTYVIPYSGVATAAKASASQSNKLYVSAAIYDDKDVMQYYGVLGEVNADSGQVSLTIPADLDPNSTYKLAIFEEQRSGSFVQSMPTKRKDDSIASVTSFTTDYVSPMNVATFKVAGLSATAKEGAFLNEDSTYTKAQIAEMLEVAQNSVGELQADQYYILSKEEFDAMEDKSDEAIRNAVHLDSISTGNGSVEDGVQEIVVIQFLAEGLVASTEVSLPVVASEGADYEGVAAGEWYEAEKNGVTWRYKLNSNGKIAAMYTTEDVSAIVNEAGTLVIPSKLDDLAVIGIGGGNEKMPVIPRDSEVEFGEISLPTGLTAINDYAFFGVDQAAFSVRIPEKVKRIGSKAFAKSGIVRLQVQGMNGQIAFRAFAQTKSLTGASLTAGETGISIGKEAFDGSVLDTLTLKGTFAIGENAFRNNTELSEVSVPFGGTAAASAFAGCTKLQKIEWDMERLENDVFAGCADVGTLIFGSHVSRVAFRWDGGSSAVAARKIYVQNPETRFEIFKDLEGQVARAFGNSGMITIFYQGGDDLGENESPQDGILSLNAKTADQRGSTIGAAYYDYLQAFGPTIQIRFEETENQMEEVIKADNDEAGTEEAVQTGIEALYDGTVLVPGAPEKENLTVTQLFGNKEGEAYGKDDYYLIRTRDFNDISQEMSEELVASFAS